MKHFLTYFLRLGLQWPYRSRSLCCAMCKYSTQNTYNFRNHVSRCHSYMRSVCALASCSQCVFTGHPRVVKKHMLFFHAKVPIHSQPSREAASVIPRSSERYHCRRCAFPSSSIFAMKKHIILKHLDNLAEMYIGYRLNVQGRTTVKIYCCKVCRVNTGNLDQMLHHMLVEPSHYSVSTQVQNLIYENKNYTIKSVPNGNSLFVTLPSIAPKPQQPQMLNSKSLVLPSNGQPTGTVVALQQVQGTANSATLICTPGTNPAFLPPQASALVQLASAEAKGLLQPGATIALRSALPHGPPMVQLPTVSNVALKQTPVTLTPAQPQPTQNTQQILLPSGLQANMAAAPPAVSKPAVAAQNASNNQITLKGTMLTSQSLLSHLIPTGNKVNGLPTYTFAPLQVAVPASQSAPLKPVEQASNLAPQTKKWITCPLCNELFPSNVFDMHTEVAHQTKSNSSRSESVAARASFLKKMPDKTVKCLTCRIQLSEKSVFQHLLHGLSCLYCSALFFSIKHLLEHVKHHNPTSKTYCDFLRQKFGLYSNGVAGILFPYVDVHTTAPKEILGDIEVNLALVTNSLDLIYFKLQPNSQTEICPAPVKINTSFCPFCDEKYQNESKHVEHLKQKHFVAPTIHAILKTEAFKCIYCNGVYTGKVTQQAVMLHIQRCRCSPKPPQPPKITAAPPLSAPSGLYFLKVPQGLTVKQTIAPACVSGPAVSAEMAAEQQSKKRLEAALKEVIEANKREREKRAAVRRRREQGKPPSQRSVSRRKPSVKLLLEPSLVEQRVVQDRRYFISKYFNRNPYITRAECGVLCKRLSLNRPDLAGSFATKRAMCLRRIRRNKTAVLLGFNMTALSKVKHNLRIPELHAAHAIEQPPTVAAKQPDCAVEEPEPMDESGNEKVPNGEPVEQI